MTTHCLAHPNLQVRVGGGWGQLLLRERNLTCQTEKRPLVRTFSVETCGAEWENTQALRINTCIIQPKS